MLRPVSVHLMYQKCSYRDSSSTYNVIMDSFNSFLSRSIRNLTLASLSLLFTIKVDVLPFLHILIPTVVFFYESNY